MKEEFDVQSVMLFLSSLSFASGEEFDVAALMLVS